MQVQEDIIASLKMRSPLRLVSSFDRPNIHYLVEPLKEAEEPVSKIAKQLLLDSWEDRLPCAIIYALKRESADEIALRLQTLGALHVLAGRICPALTLKKITLLHNIYIVSRKTTFIKGSGYSANQLQRDSVFWLALRNCRCLPDTFSFPVGIPCKAYHAGLKSTLRTQILADWTSGTVPVVAATVAFGMGIDKAGGHDAYCLNPKRSMKAGQG